MVHPGIRAYEGLSLERKPPSPCARTSAGSSFEPRARYSRIAFDSARAKPSSTMKGTRPKGFTLRKSFARTAPPAMSRRIALVRDRELPEEQPHLVRVSGDR